MKDNFATALAFTLKYEGGKANSPFDPGGRTNEGITQRTYIAWLRSKGYTGYRDVFNITATERDAIYKQNYWDKIGADNIQPGLDLALFDLAVNSGPARALVWKTKIGYQGGSLVGKITTACSWRLSFMHRLGSLWQRFGKGWTSRVNACKDAAIKLATPPVILAAKS